MFGKRRTKYHQKLSNKSQLRYGSVFSNKRNMPASQPGGLWRESFNFLSLALWLTVDGELDDGVDLPVLVLHPIASQALV